MTLRGAFVNEINASHLHGEQKVLTVGKDPMGFAFSPDGKTMLVANHGDGSVSVIDLKEWKVVNTFHAGTGIETLDVLLIVVVEKSHSRMRDAFF